MEPPPTLDDLVKAVRIQPALLEQECSDEHLKTISLFLAWRTVAPHLGLSESDIQEIEWDCKTESEKRLKTLLKWKTKYAFKAKFNNLVLALLKVGNASHAERVCRLLVPQACKGDNGNVYSLVQKLLEGAASPEMSSKTGPNTESTEGGDVHNLANFGTLVEDCTTRGILQHDSGLHLDGQPTLPQLLHFPGKDGRIDIPQRIGTKYSKLGIILLKDSTGTRVDAITRKHREDAEDINLEILKQWLQGGGKNPVCWKTLVEVLEQIGLRVLADDIRNVLL